MSRSADTHAGEMVKPLGESIALPIMPKSLALEGGSETDWIDNLG